MNVGTDLNRRGAPALGDKKKKHPSQTRIGALVWPDEFFHHDVSCPRCTVDCGLRYDQYTLALSALSYPARRAFQLMVARSGWGGRIVSYSIPLLADQAGISARAMRDAIPELLRGKYGFSEGYLLEEVKLTLDERGKGFFDCSANCASHGGEQGRHFTKHRALRVKLHPDHATKDCVCWDDRSKDAKPWAHSVPSWMFAQRTKPGAPPVPLLMAEVALYLAGLGYRAFKKNRTIIEGMALNHKSDSTIRSVLADLEMFTGSKRTARKRHSTLIELSQDWPAEVEYEARRKTGGDPAQNRQQPGMEPATTRRKTGDLDKGLSQRLEAEALGDKIRLEERRLVRDKMMQIARLNSEPQSPEREQVVKMLLDDAYAILDRNPADAVRLTCELEAILKAGGYAEKSESPKAGVAGAA